MGMGAIFFVGSEHLPTLPPSLESEYMYASYLHSWSRSHLLIV